MQPYLGRVGRHVRGARFGQRNLARTKLHRVDRSQLKRGAGKLGHAASIATVARSTLGSARCHIRRGAVRAKKLVQRLVRRVVAAAAVWIVAGG